MYANKAYVQFDRIESAKKAYDGLNEKRIDGCIWHIYPTKKYT